MNQEEFLRIVDATPLVSIDLILRNDGGEVLLGRRTNRPAQGYWFVPGGRIRKNEPVAAALRRISQRELGHELSEAKLLGVYDHIYPDNFLNESGVNTHYVVLGMEATWPAGKSIRADEQHDAFQWWKISDLLASAQVHPNTKAYFTSNEAPGFRTSPSQ